MSPNHEAPDPAGPTRDVPAPRPGEQAPATSAEPTRRSALVAMLALAGGLAASMLGLAGGFLANALGQRRDNDWIRVGAAEDLDAEMFQRTVIAEEHQHAWLSERERSVVYIKDYYPEDPVALLATCSHLGCMVDWRAEESRFVCPCHGAIYGEDGSRVSGPQPRGLTRLEVKIEDEICYVRMPDAGNPA